MSLSRQQEGVRRLSSLDVARGIAILMVIFGHFIPLRFPLGQAAYYVTSLGRGGVLLFFLLSGYLVFRNVEKQDTATFLSRRMFKIFPAYWVNVIIVFLFGSVVGSAEDHDLKLFLSNFVMVQDIFHAPTLSGIYWTLLIEIKFYFLIPLQYLLLRDRGSIVILVAFVFLNAVIWFVRGQASLLLTFFPLFYVGIQIRRAETGGWTGSALLMLAAVTCFVAGSLFVFDIQYGSWSAIYTIFAVSLLVVMMRRNTSNTVLSFFGRISYSHYLYHTSVGYVFLSAVPTTTTLFGDAIVVFFAVLLTTAVAFVSFRLVEAPMVAFGKAQERHWKRIRIQHTNEQPL